MKTQQKLGAILTMAAGLLTFSGALWAHHSEAIFDKEHMTTIKGVITLHEFVNPHQLIHMKVTDASGQTIQWTLQGSPPSGMRKGGWTPETVKPGEEVTVNGFACKDGRPCMTWIRIVKSDGTIIPPDGIKNGMLAEFLSKHSNEISKEEYELYKKSLNMQVVERYRKPETAGSGPQKY